MTTKSAQYIVHILKSVQSRKGNSTMKKTISIAILLFSIFSILCFANSPKSTKKKLQFMMFGDAEERDIYSKIFKKFAIKYPEIGMPKILHLGSFAYWDKFMVLQACEQLPDVFYMGTEELTMYKDKLLDLTDLIKQDSDKIKIKDFYPQVMNAFQLNGRQYGIPKNFSTLVLYYNIDLFNKMGINLPTNNWTWNDLLRAAKQLTIRNNKKILRYGFLVETWQSWISAFAWSNNGRFIDPSGTKWVMGKQPYLTHNAEAYQFLADMINKHKVAPDIYKSRILGGEGAFANGRVAMCIYGRWALLRLKNIRNFRWGIAEIPRSPSTGKRISTLFSLAYSINKNSPMKKEAWTLVKYLSQPKTQSLLTQTETVIPARRSIATSDMFLKSSEINKYQKQLGNDAIDHQAFLRALKYSQLIPKHPNWLQIREKLDLWFMNVFNGTLKAKYRILQKQKEFEKMMK